MYNTLFVVFFRFGIVEYRSNFIRVPISHTILHEFVETDDVAGERSIFETCIALVVDQLDTGEGSSFLLFCCC